MMSPRRSGSGAGGLSSNALSQSRKSGSAPASTTKRASATAASADDGSGLIVTRGLQEILERERRLRRPSESAAQGGVGGKDGKGSKTHRRSSGQAPNFIICYLCGRQFGSASIDIHRPQCYLKKLIEWERNDPAMRGPKPLTPEAHEKMMKTRVANASAAAATAGHPGAARLSGGPAGRRASDVEMYNQLQMDAFNETALSPCPNCGRTFLPDRLQIHLRSCKPGHTARPVRRASAPTGGNATNAAAVGGGAAAPSSASSPDIMGHGEPRARNGVSSNAPVVATGKAGGVQDRPIKASGAYAVPDSAGPEDVPPRASTGVTAVRARGSYAVAEDGVPPSQAPSAQKPGRGPSLSNTTTTRPQRGVSEGAVSAEEAEPRDTVMELDPEEAKPPSPRADTERRLSSVAILRGDPDVSGGSSAPNRPASMEPSALNGHSHSPEEERAESISVVYALSQNRGREHAAGSRPRRHGSTSVPMPELISEQREEDGIVVEIDSDADELESMPVAGGHGRVCQVVECDVDSPGAAAGDQREQRKPWTPKKIPLNNVSRFKNVESRLKVQREAELSMFVPCQYCGRTFVPERVQKHEECCVERNKPPARRSVQLKSRPSSASAASPRQTKSASPSASTSANNSAPHVAAPKPASASPSVAKPTAPAPAPAAVAAPAPVTATGKAKFCGGCGVKTMSEGQKFCTECGFKL